MMAISRIVPWRERSSIIARIRIAKFGYLLRGMCKAKCRASIVKEDPEGQPCESPSTKATNSASLPGK
jgi:hypothetical protein